jgi:CDP-glycerol glycerophosphotransferase (TagB/SpsB family)
LNKLGLELLPALAAAGYNVIVKLHDRCYDRDRGAGGIDWARTLSRFNDHPHIRTVSDPDATPFLLLADALITDHSSIGFEYMLLDRPIVVIDCPQLIAHAKVHPDRVADLRTAAEVADSVPGVLSALSLQLEEPSLHSQERREAAGRFFYKPGTATARAVATVYEVLELEEPQSKSPAPRTGLEAPVGPVREQGAAVGR